MKEGLYNRSDSKVYKKSGKEKCENKHVTDTKRTPDSLLPN